MNKRLVGYIILVNIFLSVLVPTSFSTSDEALWWNENWSFREEIVIPIDTSVEEAKYQPIDILIEFNNSCWAIDENEHSVRVIVQESGRFQELESQIYDLNYSDETHISSCSLVFLIPKDVSGHERYFVYYDDEEKPGPGYVDHVSIDESYYQYEPIPGLSFESWFYKIIEEDFIVYGVAKKGSALGDPICHQVTKLKPGSKKVLPKNGELLASFNFVYWWKPTDNDKYTLKSSSEKLVKKQIFVDGNLMVKFGIVSRSKDETIQSTVIYKYYYTPDEDKRIYTHVKHEVIGFPLELGVDIDVSYATISCGGVKSSTISDLNFGTIPPYLHFYGDEEKIISQDIPYPESKDWEEIIGKQDDYDLGSSAWLSVDNGKSGKAHAIIFESNDIVKSGTDERNGMELQLHEANEINLPGLDARLAYVYIMRNSYEPDEGVDLNVPRDLIVEYKAEFFTTENGGYKTVEKEADIYQSLISYQPGNGNNVTEGDGDGEEYSLTIFGHLSPSLISKLMGLTLLLKSPYITAELHHKDDVSVGTLSRFRLTKDLKIDWKNVTLFKKYQFTSLEPGIYVVKLWLENTLLDDKREFIGAQVVDLQSDKEIHIFCRPEGKISVSVSDQNNNGIENTEIYLLKDGVTIAENNTDCDGNALIGAPSGLTEIYTLKVMYKGFLINEEQVRLIGATALLPLKKSFSFNVHNLTISLRDAHGEIPAFDADISLISDEMDEPYSLDTDIADKGDYTFFKLHPGNYILSINYDCFKIKELINIPTVGKMDINLYDFTLTVKDNWNLAPDVKLDVTIVSEDFENEVKLKGEALSSDKYVFSNLYPGRYTLKVGYRTHVYEESIKIPNSHDGNMSITFPAEFDVKIKVFDAQANPLANAKVILMRGKDNESHGFTDNNGYIVFTLPPGHYDCEIHSGGELVAERNINVLDDKSVTIVTTKKPLSNYVIIAIAFIIIAAAMIISRRKKDPILFLKILAIVMAVVAIISPWWSLFGSSTEPKIATSTKMYILPTEMVTITNANDVVTAGTLATLEETFEYGVSILPLAISVAVILIFLSLILKKYDRKKLSEAAFVFSNCLFVISIVGFYYAMSEMTKVMVGGFTGSGNLEISIPGRETFETLSCNWGPDIGFYLLLISTVIILFVTIWEIKIFLQNKKKPVTK